MKVLVTGAAGFIGSHLVKRLAGDEENNVIAIDNFSSPNQKLQQDRRKWVGDEVSWHQLDLCDFDGLETLFQTEKFDLVYHLGAKAGVRESITNPFIYGQSNYIGTLNILEAAKRNSVSHVVAASSSSVYGRETEAPFAEDSNAMEPISVYASTKRSGELLAYTYCDLHGMNVTNLRFFTVYGPFGRPDMAPWIFTEKIMDGETIQVFDHGSHKRDFTYIDDIIDGIIGAGSHPKGFNTLNLGNGNPVSLMDFISVIETALGIEAKTDFVEAQPGDVNLTYSDNTKAKDLFGYQPKTDITEGMNKFISWYKDWR